MNEAQTQLIDLISQARFDDLEEVHLLCQTLPTSSDQQMLDFLDQLVAVTHDNEPPVPSEAWEIILAGCEAWARRRTAADVGELPEPAADLIGQLYTQLGPAQACRYHLLSILATIGQATELSVFCDLMLADPPLGLAAATAPFFPLLADHVEVELLFPRLLECLENQDVGVAVLELANHLTRAGRFGTHPGATRSTQLIGLLGGVTAGLEQLQQQAMSRNEEDTSERRQAVSNGVSLAVALADSLGLIQEEQAVRALTDLMEIKHRRIRVEAAAALTRLGHAEAKQTLLNLAAEPSVRLRVLAYAEELDCEEELAEEFRSPVATAEAELVTYLAQPTNMGVPPSQCELIHTRTLYWPGFEEPRNCYLFRYTYHAAEPDGRLSSFSNLGIAGPLVHAFQASIDDLTPADAYALFAGWQAEHEEIRQFQLDSDEPVHPILADHFQRLEAEGCAEIACELHGKFFGDDTLVAKCQQGDVPGAAVVDAQAVHWYPHQDTQQAYCLYKGTRLLQAFNEDFPF